MTGRDVPEFGLSVLLGLLFLASVAPKLRHPKGFILTVLEYRMLPSPLGRLYGRLLPPVELWLGILLVTGTAVRLASALASVLFTSFIVGVAVNLARGRHLDCGCTGPGRSRQIGWPLVFQDSGLLILCLLLAILDRRWPNPEPWSIFQFGGTVVRAGAISLVGSTAMSVLFWAITCRNLRPWKGVEAQYGDSLSSWNVASEAGEGGNA